jgi:hypothetical protein
VEIVKKIDGGAGGAPGGKEFHRQARRGPLLSSGLIFQILLEEGVSPDLEGLVQGSFALVGQLRGQPDPPAGL